MPPNLLAAKKTHSRSDAPSHSLARIAWILLVLINDGVVDYSACIDRFGISRREFQRDLLKIREIGKGHGFVVSQITAGRVFFHASGHQFERLNEKSRDVMATLNEIATALGGPIEREMRGAIGPGHSDQRVGFLQIREALPSNGGYVTQIFAFLKDAAAGSARVEFSYAAARGARMVRRVEPYHVVARDSRFYLVGYDLKRQDWRYFALDAINEPMRRDGTFKPRSVPKRYLAERSIGWISGSGAVNVTVRLSPVVATAVTARTWQSDQQVAILPCGGAEITLAFDDIGEAVRWTLRFGPEAVVIAPSEAVNFARHLIDRIADAYTAQHSLDRQEMAG